MVEAVKGGTYWNQSAMHHASVFSRRDSVVGGGGGGTVRGGRESGGGAGEKRWEEDRSHIERRTNHRVGRDRQTDTHAGALYLQSSVEGERWERDVRVVTTTTTTTTTTATTTTTTTTREKCQSSFAKSPISIKSKQVRVPLVAWRTVEPKEKSRRPGPGHGSLLTIEGPINTAGDLMHTDVLKYNKSASLLGWFGFINTFIDLYFLLCALVELNKR